MRFSFQSFVVAMLLLMSSNAVFAQSDGSGRKGGHWFLGLNGGVAWNQSDVKTRLGGGTGFYLGKNIWYSKILSLDLRGRYLWTTTYGLDHNRTMLATDSTATMTDRLLLDDPLLGGPDYSTGAGYEGYVYHNYNTNFHDLALEARVNFEFLKPLWLSLYGGADLGIYKARFDQSTIFGQYDYKTVFENFEQLGASRGDIREQINLQRDFEYETTALDNRSNGWRAGFMPNVGIELGWWITPRFAIGIGHRVNFTLTDKFEGVVSDKTDKWNSAIHHYTSLQLHWRFMGKADYIQWGGNVRGDNNNNTVINNNNNNTNPPCQQPVVTITTPSGRTNNVASTPTTIRATINNLTDASQITFTVAGTATRNFTFNHTTGEFVATINVNNGANDISIRAQNACGTATQVTTINYQAVQPDPVVTQQPPVVTITNPAQDPFTTTTTPVSIYATILNVQSSSNISFTVNGNANTNFTFSGTTFTATGVGLNPGNNTIVITGSNAVGMDSETQTIVYNVSNPVKTPPVVTITNPATDPFTTTTSTVGVVATILNVPTRNNVTFTVNGVTNTNFNFSGTTFSAANVGLNPGNNTIVISAYNNDGTASDQTVVVYNPPCNPPSLTINSPMNGSTSMANTATVNASLSNVANRNEISFMVNGVANQGFTYNNGQFSATINLQPGANTISLTANTACGNANRTITINYNQPCNPPVVTINAPANGSTTNTNSATINAVLTNVAAKSDVTFTINGTSSSMFSFNNGVFSANVNLQQGSNTFVIAAKNNCGNASQSVTVNYNVPCNPPTLVVNSPMNGSTVNTNTVTVNATFANVINRNDVRFTVNGVANQGFTYNNGQFSATINLQQGANTISLSATTNCGNVSQSATVTYNVPCNPPSLSLNAPMNNSSVTTNTVNVSAVLTNVPNRNDINFYVNGVANQGFTYNNGVLNATVNLQQGSNTINISAATNCGNASQSVNVTYNAPCNPPTLVINTPANGSTTTNNSATISAALTNVASKNDITFTINGNSSSMFSFNNGIFSANVNLQQGSNVFVIAAKNNCGNVDQSVTVNYNAPCNPPTLNVSAPMNNSTVTTNTVTVNAVFTNVPDRNSITFKVNGVANQGFTYNNGVFSATVNLQTGSNAINLAAATSCGNVNQTANVTYNAPCNPPTLVITSPANGSTTTNNSATISATLTNVASKNDITFTINGNSSSMFSFNNGVFSANVNLQQGSNVFVIAAKNTCGNVNQSVTVNYNAPCNPPTLNVSAPMNNSTVTTNTVTVNAVFTNVPDRNSITFKVNGVANQGFTYNNGVFSATVNLQTGSNAINLAAATSCGNVNQTANVTYNAPCNPPTLIVHSPAMNAVVNVNAPVINVQAMFTNVTSSNQITFTVNGNNSTNFNYVAQSGNFVSTVNGLQQGANVLVLSATTPCGTVSQTINVSYQPNQQPCNQPTVAITAPANGSSVSNNVATVTATLAYVTNRNDISFTVNGVSNNGFSFNNGQFSANVTLQTGNNAFVIAAKNNCGNATQTTTVTYNQPCNPPTITITQPQSKTVSMEVLNVAAMLTNVPAKSNIMFSVNGVNTQDFNYNAQTGQMTATINLRSGANTFTITVNNNCGTDTETGNVAYVPAVVVNPPTVNITTPSTNPFTSTTSSTTIVATITNMSSSNGIVFTVNGQTNTNFSFSGTTFTATNVSLNGGNNTVVITATNQGGTASDNTTIVYNPCTPPTLKINAPANNSTTTNATATVTATLSGIMNKSDVSFTVNGSSVSNFNFVAMTGAFSATVNLQQGQNSMVIAAKNGCGNVNQSVTVTYQQPIPAPTVQIIRPTENPLTVINATNTATVVATVANVTASNQVTVTINGAPFTGFTLSGNTVSIPSAPIGVGNNTITVTATTPGGTASDNTVVIRQPAASNMENGGGSNGNGSMGNDAGKSGKIGGDVESKPTLNITSPKSGSTVSSAATTITATVSGISNVAQVVVTANMKPVKGATLNGTTLSIPVTLTKGANTIVITATNTAGVATQTITLNLP